MSTICTCCRNSGFENIHQLIERDWEFAALTIPGDPAILEWIETHNDHDIQICTCCGDGEEWYGLPGEHYNTADPPGDNGPYAYNGGLCKCH